MELLLYKNSNGESIISYASSYGHDDVVRFLLRHGIEANQENTNGTISLHSAAYNGHYQVAELELLLVKQLLMGLLRCILLH